MSMNVNALRSVFQTLLSSSTAGPSAAVAKPSHQNVLGNFPSSKTSQSADPLGVAADSGDSTGSTKSDLEKALATVLVDVIKSLVQNLSHDCGSSSSSGGSPSSSISGISPSGSGSSQPAATAAAAAPGSATVNAAPSAAGSTTAPLTGGSSQPSSQELNSSASNLPSTTSTTTGSQNLGSVGAGKPQGRITMGGMDGLGDLADPAASAKFRAGGGGLYIHAMGWAQLSDAQKHAIGTNFKGTGGVDVETSSNDNMKSSYLGNGIDKVSEVNINSPTDTLAGAASPAAWAGNVNNWKSENAGVQDAQYNITPNQPGGPPKPFSDPMWDSIRQRAKQGGGIILDVPPSMYTSVMGNNYRQFIQDEVRWANANGLHSTVILSGLGSDALPSGSDPGGFAKSTQAMVAAFNALPPDQRPQQYALENYGAGVGVGTEDQPGTIANVALWCLHNASTYNPKG